MEIAFLQAKYFSHPPAPRKVDLVVIHAAEVKESSGAAEWLMKYCANNDRQASWHYAVDCDSVTQSVKEEDVAWHAPGANKNGIGVELATIGLPSTAQWADAYSQKMMTLAAFLTAGICARWKIEPFFVDAAGLLEGRRGVTTHAQVSIAFKKSDHMDPGPNFPMDDFLKKIKARLDVGDFQA
jgi:N-acetyl-anhydromuramyl-L-alanine amidase AmpD